MTQPQDDPNPEQALARRRRRRFWLPVVSTAGVCIVLSALLGIGNGSLQDFLVTLAVLGIPMTLGVAVFAALKTFGLQPRWRCGFCGYDLRSTPATGLCPECGQPADQPNAPGHKPVGDRRLPVWIWLPACAVVPAGLMLSAAGGGQHFLTGCWATMAALVAVLIAGVIHAANQARP
ncbi:MAG: hypothetical protein K2Q20_13265 [Phycisphaerales bacterium]|nr:hypothetical protein [Phycisphaerales bacterium]